MKDELDGNAGDQRRRMRRGLRRRPAAGADLLDGAVRRRRAVRRRHRRARVHALAAAAGRPGFVQLRLRPARISGRLHPSLLLRRVDRLRRRHRALTLMSSLARSLASVSSLLRQQHTVPVTVWSA